MQRLLVTWALVWMCAAPAFAQHKATAITADGDVVYVSKVPGDTASIATYYNRTIYNNAGEALGEVNDLLLGPDGKIATAVIGVGGFLGLGETQVAVPFTALKVLTKDMSWQLIMDTTKESLRKAPAFTQTAAQTAAQTARSGTNLPATQSPIPPH